MRFRLQTLIPVLGLTLLFSASAHAKINPGFTPRHLVQKAGESGYAAVLELGSFDANGKMAGQIKEMLAGKCDKKEVTFDLKLNPNEDQAKAVKTLMAGEKMLGILFVGTFPDPNPNLPDIMKGYLHTNGKWVALNDHNGVWEPEKQEQGMEATWAGGTDMLLRCLKYSLATPEDGDPIPSVSGVCFDGTDSETAMNLLGKVEGKVYLTQVISLDGTTSSLFVGAEKGDKLIAIKATEEKVSGTEKVLTSKSMLAAWADLNGDGKTDLLSYNGTDLAIYTQEADGSLKENKVALGDALKEGCTSLSVLDVGQKGKPGVLVGMKKGSPVLLVPGADGALQAKKLADGDAKNFGQAGLCLVADLDNDSQLDVLQLFEKGSLLFKGKAPGDFDAPKACNVALGKGNGTAALGDYDADGLLDVFTSSEDNNQIWQNTGNAVFVESFHISGEIAYISKSGALNVYTCDINNDGRQDLAMIYGNMAPQFFFNRGFRSTGHAHEMDFKGNAADNGAQCGVVADLNNDGGQDLVLVMPDGNIQAMLRKKDENRNLGIQLSVAPKSASQGPVNVQISIGSDKKRMLGAWYVAPGTGTAFAGVLEAAPCSLSWKMPGGAEQKKQVTIETNVVKVNLE